MSTNLWWGLWDLSLALGFAGAAMMGVQFVLTARFRRATAPYGIDVITISIGTWASSPGSSRSPTPSFFS